MYLVFDIGGSFVKYALMDSAGNISVKGKYPTPKTNLEEFEQLLVSIIEQQDLTTIKGIAISCPGKVDVHTGTIYQGGSLPFLHGVNLPRKIRDKYNQDVFIENDGKCAALAELWLGSVKNVKNAVVLVLGSGVGGGIIVEGNLYRGANFFAGEVSYVTSEFDPLTKQSTYVGFENSAVEMVKQIGEIKHLADPMDGKRVFEYITKNDDEATKIFNQFCLTLANQIMNLQYILDPDLFAIGGGISAQPVLIERLNWAINEVKNSTLFHVASPNVVACKFQNDANLYGALYHFLINKSVFKYDLQISEHDYI